MVAIGWVQRVKKEGKGHIAQISAHVLPRQSRAQSAERFVSASNINVIFIDHVPIKVGGVNNTHVYTSYLYTCTFVDEEKQL